MHLSRRDLLPASALLCLVPGGVGVAASRLAPNGRDTALTRALRALLPDLGNAAAVGRRLCARSHVREDGLAELEVLLVTTAAEGEAALHRAAAAARHRDFVWGDLVVADGWILARTEAQLCVLAARCTA